MSLEFKCGVSQDNGGCGELVDEEEEPESPGHFSDRIVQPEV